MVMKTYTFGDDSNIVIQAPSEFVEYYNYVVDMNSQNRHEEVDMVPLFGYNAVLYLIDKKALELHQKGLKPSKGTGRFLVELD